MTGPISDPVETARQAIEMYAVAPEEELGAAVSDLIDAVRADERRKTARAIAERIENLDGDTGYYAGYAESMRSRAVEAAESYAEESL